MFSEVNFMYKIDERCEFFFVTGTIILTQCYKLVVCFWKSSSFLLLVSFCLTVAVLFLRFSTITFDFFFPFRLPLRI